MPWVASAVARDVLDSCRVARDAVEVESAFGPIAL